MLRDHRVLVENQDMTRILTRYICNEQIRGRILERIKFLALLFGGIVVVLGLLGQRRAVA